MTTRRSLIGRRLSTTFGCMILLVPLAACGQTVPNQDFRNGQESPVGWTLSGGQGEWTERDSLSVTGNGEDSNYWRCDVALRPNSLYRFRMRGRRQSTGGSAIAGPAFANRDYSALTSEWDWYAHIFECQVTLNSLSCVSANGRQKAAFNLTKFNSYPSSPVTAQLATWSWAKARTFSTTATSFSACSTTRPAISIVR